MPVFIVSGLLVSLVAAATAAATTVLSFFLSTVGESSATSSASVLIESTLSIAAGAVSASSCVSDGSS